MNQPKFLYQYSNKPIDEFVCDLCKYLTGIGCVGNAGEDIKVKVTGADTTSGFLIDKLTSLDNSVTFTIINPGGNEQLDLSVVGGGICCDVESITVTEGQALIGSSSVVPNKLYLVTDAYDDTCQIFLRGLDTTLFTEQGYGTFTNANTIGQVNALMKYNITSDKVTEVYLAERNVRVTQSWDGNQSFGNSIDWYNFNNNIAFGTQEVNVDIRDCTWNGPSLNCIVGTNSIYINTTFNLSTTVWPNYNNVIQNSIITVTGTNIQDTIYNTFKQCVININSSYIKGTEILPEAIVTLTDSEVESCYFADKCTVTLNTNEFRRCKVGTSKTVVAPSGYNASSASIEDLDSTFEVFVNPNGSGVLDLTNYKFGGIIRIGTTGVPASWDLKQITNFSTSHIFCIVPADSNLVDVYDAGAGGNNIYLSTASVVTYDGDKDDTLVVRSGLNSSSRLFQIGGWQAPSA